MRKNTARVRSNRQRAKGRHKDQGAETSLIATFHTDQHWVSHASFSEGLEKGVATRIRHEQEREQNNTLL